MAELRPAALAFDTIAATFDARFGEWRSVAAQRRAVRRELVKAFPDAGRVIEIGGGTGEDAAWLLHRGYEVLLTDVSPMMIGVAQRKFVANQRARACVAAAEEFEPFAKQILEGTERRFDGAFSNFAALNCVADLTSVSRGLAHLIRPGGSVILVLFGPFSPGEILVESVRGRWRSVLRRLNSGDVPARLGGHSFAVRYHRPRQVAEIMTPWFRPVRKVGIGVFVPPSAAEPWISKHPGLLAILERLDAWLGRPLALLGDHLLYRFERTDTPAP